MENEPGISDVPFRLRGAPKRRYSATAAGALEGRDGGGRDLDSCQNQNAGAEESAGI